MNEGQTPQKNVKTQWQQNLKVLWFGNFMVGIAFSLIMPFMALYIDTLGDFSETQLAFWSGLSFSSTFLVTAVVSPWWGKIADRKGRKLMLIRASLGMAVVLGLMGLTTSVYQLIALRLLQGVFSGFIANANALVATQVPKEKSGQALGTLTTGNVTGTLLGPLLGGVVSGFFGYRITFFITSAVLFTVFFMVVFLVHENFTPISKEDTPSVKLLFSKLNHPRMIFGLFITTMIIQASNTSISPILSLYVRQLLNGHGNLEMISGVVASIPGIATLVAAPRFGRLGDEIGTERILTGGLIFAMLVFIPMAFVSNVWQLMGLRFLMGIADAALIPAVQTLLAKHTPHESAGRMFSYNQSFQATGNVLGPMIGSGVSGAFGYRGVFLSTSILVLINFFVVRFNTAEIRVHDEDED